MSHSYEFHLDHAGHSLTVTVHAGRTTTAELLVDGKETGEAQVHGPDSLMLSGELPDEPPQPFQVEVQHRTHRGAHPTCMLRMNGRHSYLPERHPLPM